MTMANILRRHTSRKRAGLVVRLAMTIALAVAGGGVLAASQVGNPEAGALKADDERCRECHGDHGEVEGNNESMKVPRLAGQHPEYLLKQLRDFASGARKHEFMNRVAADLDPLDAADIIAFYVQHGGKGARASGPQPRADIERLYREGDPARGVLACAACHGADGKTSIAQPGVPAELIPVIGGQDRHYLEEQLLNWHSGSRSNSPAAIMNIAVKSLTTSELQALAEYLEAL